MLHRTLLIGLGGTGIDLLRKFKTHYGKYYDKEQRYIQILGIDTTNQRTDSADPFLENHEFLHLGNPVITSANVMQFRKRNQFRWLPDDLPAFSVATGAGMRRLVGHIAYFWRGADVAARIERAMHTLNHAEVSGEFANVVDGAQTRVFILSSVCGGTGTGMFLDIAFLVNHLFARHNYETVRFGMLFLPSTFRQLAQSAQYATLEANGYAALQELNYYMADSFSQTRLASPADLVSGEIPIAPSPFDMCFMLGGTDEIGRQLSSSEDLYQRTAEFLFSAVAFPQIQEHIVDYHVTNARLSYASFGSFSVPLPKARYVEKYVLSIGRELLGDIFAPAQPAQDARARDVLSGTRISELRDLESLGTLRQIESLLHSEVFLHGEGGGQRQTTEHIMKEYEIWMNTRPRVVQHATAEIASIVETIEREILGERKRQASLEKGVLAGQFEICKAVLIQLQQVLDAASSTAPNLTEADVLKTYREERFIGGKSAAERLAGFRGELPQAIRSEIANELRGQVRAQVGKLRARFSDEASALGTLMGNSGFIASDFQGKAEQFLSNRRAASRSGNFANTGIGAAHIPDDQYQLDRTGLLQRYRAKFSLQDVVDENWKFQSEKFIDKLHQETAQYVSEQITRSQLLDDRLLHNGLVQAWSNLNLQNGPRRNQATTNNLFAPRDPDLRKQLQQVFDEWKGSESSPLCNISDSIDDSMLSFMRVIGRFGLADIHEVQLMRQSYEAKRKDPVEKMFLDLPTHKRRSIAGDDENEEQCKWFGLATILGLLRDFGQDLEFNGKPLRTQIADPVERHLHARLRMIDPDFQEIIEKKRDKMILDLGGNQGWAQFIYDQVEKNYPRNEFRDIGEYDRQMSEVREEMMAYLRSLGVPQYMRAGD
ncbi:MAG: tubulin-like doman-containing protein [Acidobacteriaceae bacterium]